MLNDERNLTLPPDHAKILAGSGTIGFKFNSDLLTGNFLRTLAAAKPGGRFLEMGTGTGLGACWLLDGMDPTSTLLSVEKDPASLEVARQALGHDKRLTLVLEDGNQFITSAKKRSFDLIFADSWPGKYENFEPMLDLVAPGGLYVADDMLPQPGWLEGHQTSVDALLAKMEALKDFHMTKLTWSTGLVVLSRKVGSVQGA